MSVEQKIKYTCDTGDVKSEILKIPPGIAIQTTIIIPYDVFSSSSLRRSASERKLEIDIVCAEDDSLGKYIITDVKGQKIEGILKGRDTLTRTIQTEYGEGDFEIRHVRDLKKTFNPVRVLVDFVNKKPPGFPGGSRS